MYEFTLLVREVCSRTGVYFDLGPPRCGPASPFIVSKGRARVTFVVKRQNGEKTKEKEKKVALDVAIFLLIRCE
jgi:hypothetical protein